MGKKALKVLPIDWNTSPTETNDDKAPKHRGGRLDRTTIPQTRLKPSGYTSSTEQTRHHEPRTSATGLEASLPLRQTEVRRPSLTNELRTYGWKPDVYVHSFVPESLSAINRSPAYIISTPAMEGIDFSSYISSFAGKQSLTLLDAPQFPEISDKLSVGLSDCLNPNTYGPFFETCLALDVRASIPEIRSYDLFGVPLEVRDPIEQVYSLVVPGLRENTPPVNLGDSVLLRQLVLDPTTGLPRWMKLWLSPGGGCERGLPAPGFTGYEITAVVVGIDKAHDVLYLRAHGLVLVGNPICNVSFVVPELLIQSLQRAVADVAQQLGHEDQAIKGSHKPSFTENKALYSAADLEFRMRQATITPDESNNEALELPAAMAVDNSSATEKCRISANSVARPYPMSFPRVNSEGSTPQNRDIHTRAKNSLSRNCWLDRLLFPVEANGIQQDTLPSATFSQTWFDSSLNYEQKRAIDAIQSRNFGDLCFLINGPPGTGKTKTICETVAQLGNDASFLGSILLCAPSNPAADTLALRLKPFFEPKTLLRLNHFSRTFAEVPQELLSYCCVQDDLFNLPPFQELMQYKVVITTCYAADMLVQARVTNRDLAFLQNSLISIINPDYKPAQAPLHWTALLIDEAAQATEPESLIPLTVVSPPPLHPSHESPIFAMAGDQHQLNPRTYDKTTALQRSLFERLSNATVYASHPLARKTLHRTSHERSILRPPFVNLIRNYRSHPAVLALPSSLFYEDTLIPEATHTESLLSWSMWRGRRWPVMFACNAGVDDCENILSVGGGWYNTREANKAISYARSLLDQALVSDQSEICIMSPFPAQVHLLRRLARQSDLRAVNIGPMEAFQGLESRFVIVCTTRARKRFLDEDALRGIGIVNEKKKFNVAITRAKEGLVVIGNPWILSTDPCWLEFLQFCWRNSLWHGDDPDARAKAFDEAKVDEWQPPVGLGTISGLEAALIFKDRDKGAGSQASKRFMRGTESAEEVLWRSGLQAEEAIALAGLE